MASSRVPRRRKSAAPDRPAVPPPRGSPRPARHDLAQLQHHLPHLRQALRNMAPTVESAARINLRWIVRLRWGAVAGQVITILIARRFLRSPLPLLAMLGVCAALALANLVVQLWLARGARPSDRAAALNLLADIAALTALLALS